MNYQILYFHIFSYKYHYFCINQKHNNRHANEDVESWNLFQKSPSFTEATNSPLGGGRQATATSRVVSSNRQVIEHLALVIFGLWWSSCIGHLWPLVIILHWSSRDRGNHLEICCHILFVCNIRISYVSKELLILTSVRWS